MKYATYLLKVSENRITNCLKCDTCEKVVTRIDYYRHLRSKSPLLKTGDKTRCDKFKKNDYTEKSRHMGKIKCG